MNKVLTKHIGRGAVPQQFLSQSAGSCNVFLFFFFLNVSVDSLGREQIKIMSSTLERDSISYRCKIASGNRL